MHKYLVSVLIPAYNHENYVQDTIKSIISQTYKDIELIIIDDGSKDSTYAKIQEMKEECEKRFVRIHFETKDNEGTCKTLNKLLDLAQGEYVYLIASDDMAKPQAIETEFNFLSKHKDYALCVGDDEIIDTDGQLAFWDENRNLVYDENIATYKTFVQFLQKMHSFDFNSDEFGTYNKLSIDNHIPNGFLIRKSIFEKIGHFTPEAPIEDYWMMLQISKYAKMKYINIILFQYRWHNNNTIKDNNKISKMAVKTRQKEENILKKLNLRDCLPEMTDFVHYGYKYKQTGIPNFFEISKYKNSEYKTKKVKILFKTFLLRKKI